MCLEEDRTGLVFHRNGSFHQNEMSPILCVMFASLMKKVRALIILEAGSLSRDERESHGVK